MSERCDEIIAGHRPADGAMLAIEEK